MARPELPQLYEGPVQFFKWLVLAVTLGPLLFCAGCLGLGMVMGLLSRPDSGPPPPPVTAPAAPEGGEGQPPAESSPPGGMGGRRPPAASSSPKVNPL